MIDLSNLSADEVEAWQADGVTQAVMKQLKAEYRVWSEKLELAASAGESPGKASGYAGRCLQLKEIVKALEGAKGNENA